MMDYGYTVGSDARVSRPTRDGVSAKTSIDLSSGLMASRKFTTTSKASVFSK